MSTIWTVRPTYEADQDIAEILLWTQENFSREQADIYAETLALALEDLVNGPDITGAKQRDDILPGIRLLHVARQGRRGRHILVFRVLDAGFIDVLRILHDSMDLARHISN